MRIDRSSRLIALFGAVGLLSACGAPLVTRAPAPAATPPAAAAAERPAQEAQQPRGTPYQRLITAQARTSVGLFKTHQIEGRLYFEIPLEEIGRDMLIISRQDEGGFGGGGSRSVRWERRGDRIDLRSVGYSQRADASRAISEAVSAIERGNLIATFNIEATAPDSSVVIEVTRLFTTNIPEFIQVSGLQNDRTWIESVYAFPENINVTAVQTGANAPAGTPASTIKVTWSMLRLPLNPMMPRLHDARVGIQSFAFIDYGSDAPRADQVRYIRRNRLEKANPNAALSDPIKPIEYWVDRATPEWLVPWVVRGIEAWQPAFEEAGFTNAIVARIPPSAEEDPSWSANDIRHSMIYWRPSTTQNATGGSVIDPRTGEIIRGDVNMYHNVMNLVRNWYFVQAGPLDARAQQFPMPDSIIGAMVEYVVAHEVGHALGFPHNFKASAMYPVDSIRSRSFLERMGHVATLMDYSRLNYVAQPEDNIPPELLIPKVGPYDKYAIMWMHKPIPGATTPQEEWATLDQWSRMQDTIPWFRFTTSDSPNDPHAVTEAVGNADAVRSSTLAMRNLERVMGMLLDVAEKPGEDYSLLRELYTNVVQQWGRYNGHVAALIGGAYTQERFGTGPRFTVVPRAEQQAAMQWLAQNAFQVPSFLLNIEVQRRLEADGAVTRFSNSQAGVFSTLLNEARLNRLVEHEAFAAPGAPTYTVSDLLGDLRSGVWGELQQSNPRVDVFRRSLQRTFVAAMDAYLNPEGERARSDARPIVRAEMEDLAGVIGTAAGRATDRMTQLHLQEMQREIRRLLDRGNN
jgi:hypothetical protein